jgi:hypothetical protein
VLTVVTTATPDYPKPWVFPTLGLLRECRVVCLLHPEDRRPLPRGAERSPYLTPGVLHQDGRFLDAVPGVADDDLVVLADADGVFQRDWDPDELDELDALKGGVALGYNVRPGQRGAEEYGRLCPRQPLAGAAAALGLPEEVLRGCWVYNTGFMAARAGVWRHIRRLFADTFGERGPDLFGLPSWPQYLLCCLFCLHGIPVNELGYGTHSHGHCPLTPKHHVARRQLYYAGRLVLFAHNVPGVCF